MEEALRFLYRDEERNLRMIDIIDRCHKAVVIALPAKEPAAVAWSPKRL